MENINLSLPEWAFLDGYSHEGDLLADRDVILHVKSASLIEILENANLKRGVLSYSFKNYTGENLTAALHYSATLQINTDGEYIKENILIPCANWYIEYSKLEDKNIIESNSAIHN